MQNLLAELMSKPGNRIACTAWFDALSPSNKRRHCVDFPERSSPSNKMKAPVGSCIQHPNFNIYNSATLTPSGNKRAQRSIMTYIPQPTSLDGHSAISRPVLVIPNEVIASYLMPFVSCDWCVRIRHTFNSHFSVEIVYSFTTIKGVHKAGQSIQSNITTVACILV